MAEKRTAYNFFLCVKSEGMRLLRRKSHRLMNIIKMYFRELGWGGGGVGWIDMTHERGKW
jgi:hypothetical protein